MQHEIAERDLHVEGSAFLESMLPINFETKEFYCGYLGFKVDWEHIFEESTPLYMQVSLGDFVLHLSEHYGDGCPGSTVFVKVTGLEEYHRELTEKNYKYLRPGIGDAPWKAKCVNVVDPF